MPDNNLLATLESIKEKLQTDNALSESAQEKISAMFSLLNSALQSESPEKSVQYWLENCERGNLYQKIGELTRDLHDSLQDIDNSIPLHLKNIQERDIPDAIERLNYVIEITETAANKTLDLSEELVDKMYKNKTNANELKEKLNELEDIGAIKAMLNDFFTEKLQYTEHHVEKLNEIILSQNYQDLTGQIIHKIIQLVADLEKHLAEIIQRFGVAHTAEGEKKNFDLAGPQANNSENKKSQEEIDNLLSEFGF